MFNLQRYSFRRLLLLAFLLIAGLLGAASLRSLFTLEGLLKQSSAGAEQALALSAAAQLVAERSVTMERAARQFLVLDDKALRRNFDDAAREAEESLERVLGPALPPNLVQAWRTQLTSIQAQLSGPRTDLREREYAVTTAFREIELLNVHMAEQVRRFTQERNQVLLGQLEEGRADLARQVLVAIVISLVLAFAFGLWLARPFKRLEAAIVALGENRLDEPIDMRGPTDVRLLGRRLEWLRLRLAELDADKARFLRHVSHELKTPLAALREGVALLEDGVTGELTDKQSEVARILRHNTVILQGQIEDLLRFNAAAFEARRLVRRKTELVGLLQELVEAQRLQWSARRLTVEVVGDALWVEVDQDKLGTALGNLLSNAIRFSPPGGTIGFTVSKVPGRACIDITDEGPGVAPADRARIFEPFYRGERQPMGGVRGSGIGLSLVHEYVTGHGGQVDLLPDGPGARFHVELPHVAQV
ncbi:MAG: HAMP domain-containing sensor histidine kinase [Pseudomonadota bacterium]